MAVRVDGAIDDCVVTKPCRTAPGFLASVKNDVAGAVYDGKGGHYGEPSGLRHQDNALICWWALASRLMTANFSMSHQSLW